MAVLAETLWGPELRVEKAIISSRWKNWEAWTKSEGAEAPPGPGLEPPLPYIQFLIARPFDGHISHRATAMYSNTLAVDGWVVIYICMVQRYRMHCNSEF